MSTELAKPESKRRDIKEFIQSDVVRNQVALALPRFLTPERMLRICVTSINRTPKLAECTTESLLSAIMQAAQMGIEPDGRNGHLIPRWNGKLQVTECQFQADYKGLVALVRRNGDVEDIYADVVCESDTFKITKGLHRDLVHEIDIRADRGAIIGAYAVIQYRGGVTGFEFMGRKEIEDIRAGSESWKSHVAKGYSTPWLTAEGEMFKKTALKRLLKLADLSPDTADRLDRDNEIPINDRVTEIPRAQISGSAQTRAMLTDPDGNEVARLDFPAAGAEVSTEKPTAAVVIEPGKPTPRASKKLPTKKEKPAEPKTEATPDRPQLAKLTDLLTNAGHTAEELFAVAKDNNWTEDDWKQLADMPEDKIEAFVDDFESALGELERLFPKEAATPEKSPFDS